MRVHVHLWFLDVSIYVHTYVCIHDISPTSGEVEVAQKLADKAKAALQSVRQELPGSNWRGELIPSRWESVSQISKLCGFSWFEKRDSRFMHGLLGNLGFRLSADN